MRRFVTDWVLPAEAELGPDHARLTPESLMQLQAEARAAGLWALATPERFGGAGTSLPAQAVVAEEARRLTVDWAKQRLVFGGTL